MEKVKKILLLHVPMSICNFRCHYCYLAQRDECYQGVQPDMKYSPDEVAKALSVQRIGGKAFINICAAGETLLTKNIDLYVKALLQEGHYVEFVTNLSVSSVLDKFLQWDEKILKHLEFKCSFHYLELKKKGLLETFASNVKKIWQAGASANIEITPSDELIPYIDEVKDFSLKHFGALPHITIARNDQTKGIDYLTNLSDVDYERVWSSFNSDFWSFKRSIFGKKQKEFCYAGKWSAYIDLSTGIMRQCYCGKELGDVFANPLEPFFEKAIGKCEMPHCFNGHALMTLGLVPNATSVRYGEIRDRKKQDGSYWLQSELRSFFDSKCADCNITYGNLKKRNILLKIKINKIIEKVKRHI
ncbi:MAG: radical SAM protein [Lachnospiraceae bacterium]|nr:radical SAM protein [Lachnospiraceae bacterium]